MLTVQLKSCSHDHHKGTYTFTMEVDGSIMFMIATAVRKIRNDQRKKADRGLIADALDRFARIIHDIRVGQVK